MTRRTATFAAATAAFGGGARVLRARRARARRNALQARGMCFQVAPFSAVDAGRDCECVLL